MFTFDFIVSLVLTDTLRVHHSDGEDLLDRLQEL